MVLDIEMVMFFQQPKQIWVELVLGSNLLLAVHQVLLILHHLTLLKEEVVIKLMMF